MRRAALGALALALVAGCGDDGGGAQVAWDGKPTVATHPELPGDRIATGKLRNDGDDELRLDVATAKVVDERGKPVKATVAFAAGAGHSLYPPRDAPREEPRKQQERLGFAATIPPGKSVPLTVAWHTADRAVRVDFGPASVPLAP
jgi:hypothetical protein